MPFVPVPFAAPTYNTQQSADRVIDLMLRQGDVAAQGARAQGGIWGNAVAGLGQQAGQFLQKRQDQKDQEESSAAIDSALAGFDPKNPLETYRKLVPHLGTKNATDVLAGITRLTPAADQHTMADTVSHLKAVWALQQGDPTYIERHYPEVKQIVGPGLKANTGMDLPDQFDSSLVPQLGGFLQQMSPEAPHKFTNVAPGGTVFDETKGSVAFQAPEKAGKRDIQALDTQTKQPAFVTADDIEKNPGRYQPMRTGVNVNMPKTEPPSAMTTLKPGDKGFNIAQDMAYGGTTLAQVRSLLAYNRTVDRVALYDTAKTLNPDFDPAKFDLGYKVASNPKIRQQVAAQDNVLGMVDHLLEISDKAQRSGLPILNKYALPSGVNLGNRKYANLQLARTAFADELAGALGFGSATDMNRQMGFDMTNTNLSPDDFRAGIEGVVVPFIHQKRETLVKQMGVYGKDVNEMSNAPTSAGAPAATAPTRPAGVPEGAKWDPATRTWGM